MESLRRTRVLRRLRVQRLGLRRGPLFSLVRQLLSRLPESLGEFRLLGRDFRLELGPDLACQL